MEVLINTSGIRLGEFRTEALEGYKLMGAVDHEKLMADALRVYSSVEGKLKEQQAHSSSH